MAVYGECLLTTVRKCYNIVLSRLVSKTLVSIWARGTQVLLVSRWRTDLIHVSSLRSKVTHGFVNNRSMWILLCFRWCNNVIDGNWLQEESRESGNGKSNLNTNDQYCTEANGVWCRGDWSHSSNLSVKYADFAYLSVSSYKSICLQLQRYSTLARGLSMSITMSWMNYLRFVLTRWWCRFIDAGLWFICEVDCVTPGWPDGCVCHPSIYQSASGWWSPAMIGASKCETCIVRTLGCMWKQSWCYIHVIG